MELKDLRTRIDHIDDQLIDLFRARMDVSSEIAASKRESGSIFPLAILADSESTLRGPSESEPSRWFMQSLWRISGAKNDTSAPPFKRQRSVITASCISVPSNTPHPDNTIAALGFF